MFEVERQSKEIYDLMNWAQEGVDQGTRYPGMSYEQGILDALMWLDGSSDHNPIYQDLKLNNAQYLHFFFASLQSPCLCTHHMRTGSSI